MLLSSSKLSSKNFLTSTAWTTDSHFNTGALVILSSMTLALTPPAFEIAEQPLLIDATSAPSEVANGTKNSSFACSPLIFKGPATPIGICTVPIGFSMFFCMAVFISKL